MKLLFTPLKTTEKSSMMRTEKAIHWAAWTALLLCKDTFSGIVWQSQI